MKILKSLLCLGLVLFFLAIFCSEARAEVAPPTITKFISGQNFTVAGTAPGGSEVLIYLDGNFIGQAETESTVKQNELNFIFQYQGEKMAAGVHSVMIITKDKTSLVLSAPLAEVKFALDILPAPTLIAPNENTVVGEKKPLIIGLTKSGSFVKIFIDGVYNGKTEILNHESGTANFAYKPFLNLSLGQHEVYMIAENQEGQISQPSAVSSFKVELPMPAPTLFQPVVNVNTSDSRPFIVGLTKNNSQVKVYIDNKYSGEFQAKNHQSGTANFAYKSDQTLKRGRHSVYAVAIDERGKKSTSSNIIYFLVRNSAIAQSAQEEKIDNTKIIEEPKQNDSNSQQSSAFKNADIIKEKTPAEKAIEELSQQDEKDLEKIKDFIGDREDNKDVIGGMVNEGRLSQSKLKVSLILFILFLLGVIAWLIWVNRELVKERNLQNQQEDKKDKLL